jgi:rod shape determining protein RodA
MEQNPTTNWRHFDFWLLGAVALLVIFGIPMIRSAIAGNIDSAGADQNQLIFAVIGFVAVLITASIDYHLWASISRGLYIGTAVVLAGLYLVGDALFGSARWFSVGPILIQPSEIAKIVLILVLADFFTRYQNRMDNPQWILRSLLLTMGIVIWVLLQPNLSTVILMLVLWFLLLWAAGLRIKHLLIFGGGGLIAAAASFPLLVRFDIIKDYQLQRITNFIFPDPNATHGEAYNIQQALISIGSGGLFGQGYGHGSQVQLRFLKVRWSDFIFSAMAQEFGFIGHMSRDTFGALIAYGVAAMLAFQTIVNIGVNLKMLPATGLTLPFISYGGSSLLSSLIGIGLVESVILRHKSLEF